MEAYGGFDDLQQAFVDFANKVPFYGAVIACADDAELTPAAAADDPPRHHLRHRRRRTPTIAAIDVPLSGFGSTCTVVRRDPQRGRDAGAEPLGTLRLQVPGRHSVLNALAAVAVGPRARRAASTAIAGGAGRVPGRRAALRAPRRRPRHHRRRRLRPPPDRDRRGARRRARRRAGAASSWRSSRIATRAPRSCCPSSRAALAAADDVVLTDIYAAGEDPIPGVDVEALAAAVEPPPRPAGRRWSARSTEVAADRGGAGRARRPGDHARRRLDRRRRPAGWCANSSGRHGDGGGVVTTGLPAPADKRFRRAQVQAGRAQAARPAPRAARRQAVGARPAGSRLGAWRVVTLVTESPALRVAHHHRPRQRPAVARRSAGAARRPARPEHPVGRPRGVAARG